MTLRNVHLQYDIKVINKLKAIKYFLRAILWTCVASMNKHKRHLLGPYDRDLTICISPGSWELKVNTYKSQKLNISMVNVYLQFDKKIFNKLRATIKYFQWAILWTKVTEKSICGKPKALR